MGSLIFVVVLLIWATYLSLYVARRREQVSTARSVDRFSAHMRVLQRRMVRSAVEADDAPSSGNTGSSILTAGALEEVGRAQAPRRPMPVPEADPARVARARWDHPRGVVHSNRVFAAWGGLTGLVDGLNPRRVRAYALLSLVVVAAVTAPLAALGRLGWAVPAVCVAAVAGLFVWVRLDRKSVVAARQRRATAERSATERAEVRARRAADDEAAERARQADAARPEAGPLPVAQEHAAPSARDRYEFFDLAAFEPVAEPEQTAGRRRRTEVDPVAADDSWSPVPVPPPTYTLKARAEHPLPPALEVPAGPVPIEVEDDFEDELWHGRAVGS